MLAATTEKTASTLASLIKDYAAYNCWANTQIVNWLKIKPAYLLDKEVPSSFPSLRETVHHIWSMQEWWLGSLKQLQPVGHSSVAASSSTDLFEGILHQSEALSNYVQSLTRSDLQDKCEFQFPPMGEFTRQSFEIIQHCLNHSTYHRGQIVSIARNLGLNDAPSTDYMFYVLMAK